ncbi:hypothetical protein [Bacillus paralicheniformis]|uniref:hypothetical protein n=1 Tax=Bacillus paralicheniformis TaxID=1648923 RepID=UPI0011A445F9|nr:hypothetical protein [Bacillus paralicheniformis]
MDTKEFVKIIDSLVDKKVSKPFSLGTIDPNYSSGLPRVLFDGESKVSTKRYSYIGTYKPAARDRVLMINVSGTHIIIGKIMG